MCIQAVMARANRFLRAQMPDRIFGESTHLFVKMELIDGIPRHSMRHVDESVRRVCLDAVRVRRGIHRLEQFSHGFVFADCMHSHLSCAVIGGEQIVPRFVRRDVARVRVQLDCAKKDELLGARVNAETGDFSAGTKSRVEILAARCECQWPRRTAHRNVFLKFNRAGSCVQRVNGNSIFSSNGEINVSLHFSPLEILPPLETLAP